MVALVPLVKDTGVPFPTPVIRYPIFWCDFPRQKRNSCQVSACKCEGGYTRHIEESGKGNNRWNRF